MPVQSQESKLSFICVSGVSIVCLSMIFLLDFGTVSRVWYISYYPAISTFAVQICYTNKFFSLRINFPGADKYETGTNLENIYERRGMTLVSVLFV